MPRATLADEAPGASRRRSNPLPREGYRVRPTSTSSRGRCRGSTARGPNIDRWCRCSCHHRHRRRRRSRPRTFPARTRRSSIASPRRSSRPGDRTGRRRSGWAARGSSRRRGMRRSRIRRCSSVFPACTPCRALGRPGEAASRLGSNRRLANGNCRCSSRCPARKTGRGRSWCRPSLRGWTNSRARERPRRR